MSLSSKSRLNYLYSLGFSYNNINLANIILDYNNKLIIINFNSYLRYSILLVKIKRTYRWHGKKI